jgi:bifunctional UDP-N-acetylglucosamine pyrophosphorylase/glucosamine-1-phosphate N-acetyltransferase
VILAGGSGERLEPITHTRPKQFVPILGKPLIAYQLEALEKLKIPVTIVVNKENKRYFEERIKGATIILQKEGIKGTASALSSLEDFDDDLLVIYGDIFLADFQKAIEMLVNERNAILATRVQNPENYGAIAMDEKSYLVNIVEKSSNPPSNLINAGVYKLSKKIRLYLERINPSERGELELTDAVVSLAKEDKVKVILYDNFWADVGKPWDLLDINWWALNYLIKESKILGKVEDNVKIKGKVIIERGAEIRSGTYIEGPSYIGKGCKVGPNAYIRENTVLLQNVRIGASVEVKGSVIMENSKIPHLSYVGDSIVCENVNLGAGTITANLRFDEKTVKVNVKGRKEDTGKKKLGAIIGANVKTGIGVKIMPGIKIGANAIVYPGVIVSKDVERGKVLKP